MPNEPESSRIDEAGVMKTWTTTTEADTEKVGAELETLLAPGTTILLAGDLGAGKTVLIRGLGVALGVDRREVQSPSFALIHEHHGEKGALVHVDLYRLDPEDLPALGLDELLAGPGFKAVEWGERLAEPPPDSVWIQIEAIDENRRRIVLSSEPSDGFNNLSEQAP